MQIVADLRASGITVLQRPSSSRFPWSMSLDHPAWGTAEIVFPKDFPLPAHSLLEQSIGLTPSELQHVLTRRSLVVLTMPAENETTLGATKRWLRWGRAAAGTTGLCVIDHRSEHIWSIPALEAELAHDAPLDVSALYSVRAVYDNEGMLRWMHTHGLEELGGFDLDIFEPNTEMLGTIGHDVLRSFAFQVLDGRCTPNSRRIDLITGAPAQLVPWQTFIRQAPEELISLWSRVEHGGRRAVLVERQGVSHRYSRRRFRPYHGTIETLSNALVEFPPTATDVMAERARATWPWLQHTLERYASAPEHISKEIDAQCFVKIGMRTDARFGFNTEHIWFRASRLSSDGVEAILESKPRGLKRLERGHTYQFERTEITGWLVRTRLGAILPHDDRVARMLAEYGATTL